MNSITAIPNSLVFRTKSGDVSFDTGDAPSHGTPGWYNDGEVTRTEVNYFQDATLPNDQGWMYMATFNATVGKAKRIRASRWPQRKHKGLQTGCAGFYHL